MVSRFRGYCGWDGEPALGIERHNHGGIFHSSGWLSTYGISPQRLGISGVEVKITVAVIDYRLSV
jgi:hypothetical protein